VDKWEIFCEGDFLHDSVLETVVSPSSITVVPVAVIDIAINAFLSRELSVIASSSEMSTLDGSNTCQGPVSFAEKHILNGRDTTLGIPVDGVWDISL